MAIEPTHWMSDDVAPALDKLDKALYACMDAGLSFAQVITHISTGKTNLEPGIASESRSHDASRTKGSAPATDAPGSEMLADEGKRGS